MPNMLTEGAAWAAEQRKAHASSSVTYRRGTRSIPLSATWGRSFHDLREDGGVVNEVQADDWIVTAADIVIAGSSIEPERGDQIIANGKIYEVLPFGTEPCFRKCDEQGIQLRIHTKLKGPATRI